MRRYRLKKLFRLLLNLALVCTCLVMFAGVLLFGLYAPLPPNETMPPHMAASGGEIVQQPPAVTGDPLLQPIFAWFGIPLPEAAP